jgi:hypothetical protein
MKVRQISNLAIVGKAGLSLPGRMPSPEHPFDANFLSWVVEDAQSYATESSLIKYAVV